jgi:hypothetical protein
MISTSGQDVTEQDRIDGYYSILDSTDGPCPLLWAPSWMTINASLFGLSPCLSLTVSFKLDLQDRVWQRQHPVLDLRQLLSVLGFCQPCQL